MSSEGAKAFDSVEQTLEAIEEHLTAFKQYNVEDLTPALSPLERAKMHVSLAYTINALLYIFLKTQGVSAKDIRQSYVKQELERVKAFIKTMKDAEEKSKGPKIVLDKDASKRLIHSALSADQVYVDAVKAKEGEQSSNNAKKETNVKAGGKEKRKDMKFSVKQNKRHRRK